MNELEGIHVDTHSQRAYSLVLYMLWQMDEGALGPRIGNMQHGGQAVWITCFNKGYDKARGQIL